MRSRLGLLALLSVGCHYEWVPDYMVRDVCRPGKPTVAALRARPALPLDAGTVRGRITWRGSPRPIVESMVILMGTRTWHAKIDTAGFFRIDSVPSGRYYLTIRALGFHPWKDTVQVVPGPGPEFEVSLNPAMLDGPCTGFSVVRVKKRRIGR